MKEYFQKARVEILVFSADDVIATSTGYTGVSGDGDDGD